MAYDEDVADAVRAALAAETVTEKRMFGGLAFLVGGRMAVAASGQGGLMARVDPAEGARLVETTSAEPMVMQGRSMSGWLRVAEPTEADVAAWTARGLAYVRTLPPT